MNAFRRNLSVTFPTAAPALTVTQDAATATAQAQLTTSTITDATFANAQHEVVQPNTFWQQGGNALPQPGALARAAWTCFYTNTAGDNTYEVWVDAETGAVIGGAGQGVGGSRDGVHHSDKKAPKKLQHGGTEQPGHTEKPAAISRRTTP